MSSILDDLKGDLTEQVGFRTESCEPDPPTPPKLSTRTKTSLLLKWNVSLPYKSLALETQASQHTCAFGEAASEKRNLANWDEVSGFYLESKVFGTKGTLCRESAQNNTGDQADTKVQ